MKRRRYSVKAAQDVEILITFHHCIICRSGQYTFVYVNDILTKLCHTISTSLIYRRDVEAGCARQPPVFSTSARRGVSLSAIALLLLLAHDSGTVYLPTSSLPHHSQHFVRN